MTYKEFCDKYHTNYRLTVTSDKIETKIILSWCQFEEKITLDPIEDIPKNLDVVANLLHKSIKAHYGKSKWWFESLIKRITV